jgi:formylglycine-generating enzyme required for sulfatase activity
MKNLLTIVLINSIALLALAQAPQKFSYQSVIRNAGNQLVANQNVGIKISILQGNATGSAVYAETHSPLTNANGLATLEIGGGSVLSGNFASINWANGPFFVKTETDLNGGSNYTITNTTQLLSVPYALYAATAGNNTPGPQGPQGEQGPAGNPASDDQSLSVSATGDTLFLQNGGFVIIPGISAANNSSNPLNIETVLIPAGSFTMGSPATEPERGSDELQHQVTLSAFRMSKYETTNAQYAAFLNANSISGDGIYGEGAYPGEPLIYDCGVYNGLSYIGSQWQAAAGFENHPVNCVSWYGAQEFATYAGGRLPSEAEWEYACRGGTATAFSTGVCLNNMQANYRWDLPLSGCSNTSTAYPGQTQSINSYSPNAYGLYNMHGNVWEWCADWYGAYPTTAQTNPTGTSAGTSRVLRGGYWNSRDRDCRSADRTGNGMGSYFGIGVRLAFAP